MNISVSASSCINLRITNDLSAFHISGLTKLKCGKLAVIVSREAFFNKEFKVLQRFTEPPRRIMTVYVHEDSAL